MISIKVVRGPYGTRAALVEDAHQVLGEFLSVEGPTRTSWIWTHLLPILHEIQRGDRADYTGGGNAHDLSITRAMARIETLYREPNVSHVVPFEDFFEAVSFWCEQFGPKST